MEEAKLNQQGYYYKISKLKQSKLIVISALLLTLITSWIAYSTLPVFYKEQLLKRAIKEEIRTTVCGRGCEKALERECKKIIDKIAFPTNISIEITNKNDNLSVKCYGTVPINLLVFTFSYKVYVQLP